MPGPDDVLALVRAEVPDCIAARMLSLDDPPEDADDVAAAGRDLFAHSDDHTKEIVVLSAGHTYIYRRLAADRRTVFTAVCKSTSNLGLVLGLIRQHLASFEGER